VSAERLSPLHVGLCPAEWKRPYVNEVTDLLTNGFVGTSLPHQSENSETGIRYLQGFNVRPNNLDLTRTTWVTHDFHEKNRKSHLRKGDVLVVQSGHIGTAAVVPAEAAGSNCHAVIICRFKSELVDPDFASQYLNSQIGQARLRGLHVGSSLPHINTSELGRFKLPLPPLDEQRRLAQLWITWDTAIQKIEQLIAAKERHFATTSHKLLTARKRINGFSTQWELRRADEIFETSSRKGHLTEPLLSVTQERGVIPRDMLEGRVTMPSGETSAFKLVEPGNFVISLRSFQGGLEHSSYRGLVSPAYTVLKERIKIEERFFRHYFKSADFIKRLSVAVIGIRDGKQISFQDFSSIKLPLPSIGEQKAIAALLDQAKHEINLLQSYTDALKTQKRGLMRKLLTGQWRLAKAEI
jgi:type I restriction enzyme, S subunit